MSNELNVDLAKKMSDLLEEVKLTYGLSTIGVVYAEPFEDGTFQLGSAFKGSLFEFTGLLEHVALDTKSGAYGMYEDVDWDGDDD